MIYNNINLSSLGRGHAMGCERWNDKWAHDHSSVYDRTQELSKTFDGTQFYIFWSPKVWLQVKINKFISFFVVNWSLKNIRVAFSYTIILFIHLQKAYTHRNHYKWVAGTSRGTSDHGKRCSFTWQMVCNGFQLRSPRVHTPTYWYPSGALSEQTCS